MKEEKIKVLALLPMELPKEIDLDNTLEAMQKFVGGLIECITSSYILFNTHWSPVTSPNEYFFTMAQTESSTQCSFS